MCWCVGGGEVCICVCLCGRVGMCVCKCVQLWCCLAALECVGAGGGGVK